MDGSNGALPSDRPEPVGETNRRGAGIGRSPLCGRCPTLLDGLCRNADPADVARLFPFGLHARPRKAGSVLFRQGEPFGSVLIVRSGWVAVSKLFEDGRRQIVRFALPGDLIGFEGDDAGMPYGADAVTDITVCAVERSLWFRVCASSPALAMGFAGIVAREALSAWNHVGALGQQSAMGRVANLLLDLHRRAVAQCGAHGPVTRLPINQTHIADATGLTSVHVCRTLKQMRLEGLLEFHNGELVLHDTRRLAAIAQLDPEVRLDGFAAARTALP